MKVPNSLNAFRMLFISLSRLQNEGSQPTPASMLAAPKSIKATE